MVKIKIQILLFVNISFDKKNAKNLGALENRREIPGDPLPGASGQIPRIPIIAGRKSAKQCKKAPTGEPFHQECHHCENERINP